jgi:hypothetical protein
MTYQIHRDGDTNEFEDEQEFREMCDLLDDNGVEYSTTEPEPSADGGTEVIEHTADESPTEAIEPDTDQSEADLEALDELGESLETDPLSILPGHMIDNIKGQPAINKRGYAMIAERYGVSVKAYIESYPWENDDNRCVARAVATTESGKEYQDYATAHKGDGDMPEQLVELVST